MRKLDKAALQLLLLATLANVCLAGIEFVEVDKIRSSSNCVQLCVMQCAMDFDPNLFSLCGSPVQCEISKVDCDRKCATTCKNFDKCSLDCFKHTAQGMCAEHQDTMTVKHACDHYMPLCLNRCVKENDLTKEENGLTVKSTGPDSTYELNTPKSWHEFY